MSFPIIFSPYQYGVRISDMGVSTHTELLNKAESKAFRFIDSAPLIDCLQTLTLGRIVVLLAIFMLTAPLNLLTAYLPLSSTLATHDFLFVLSPILSTSHMQKLISIFTLLESVFPPKGVSKGGPAG